MRALVFAAALAIGTGNLGTVTAQVYPSRPVTMINPFPPGAPLDTIARVVGERMRVSLGQPMIVENVAGAAGTRGVARAARAPADGYTVSVGNFSSHVLASAIYAVQYDVLKDFEPVALLASNPQLIISKTAVPATDLKGLIAWLKANPDKASAGTAGAGSPEHISGFMFRIATGTRFAFVPYRGSGPAIQDLVAGQIDLMVENPLNSLPYIRSGQIRTYAVMANTRLASAPDIPTVDEAGLPGVYFSNWNALFAPKGTPKDIIAKLNAAVVGALADPVVRSRF